MRIAVYPLNNMNKLIRDNPIEDCFDMALLSKNMSRLNDMQG